MTEPIQILKAVMVSIIGVCAALFAISYIFYTISEISMLQATVTRIIVGLILRS